MGTAWAWYICYSVGRFYDPRDNLDIDKIYIIFTYYLHCREEKPGRISATINFDRHRSLCFLDSYRGKPASQLLIGDLAPLQLSLQEPPCSVGPLVPSLCHARSSRKRSSDNISVVYPVDKGSRVAYTFVRYRTDASPWPSTSSSQPPPGRLRWRRLPGCPTRRPSGYSSGYAGRTTAAMPIARIATAQ